MAFALQSQPRINEPSRSCAPKFCSGLKLLNPCILAFCKPSPNADFFRRVHLSLQSRTKSRGRGQIGMMTRAIPVVPIRNVREGTWQWVDVYNFLYRERIILLSRDLDESYGNLILATMLYLDSVNSNDRLYFYINGLGGDLTPTLSVYDTMKSLGSRIGTFNMSFAISLMPFILAAGEKGYRAGMPLSKVMLESPEGEYMGQADDVKNEAAELVRIRDYLFKELAKNTGQSPDTIYKDLGRGKMLRSQDAMDYGIIDRVVRPRRIEEKTPSFDGNVGWS